MPRSRPRFVLRQEAHHPGYADWLVIASEAGVREIAQALERLAALPNGARIDFELHDESVRKGFGHLAFAKCSEETLATLTSRRRPWTAARLLVRLVAATVIGIGIWHTGRLVLEGIGWLVLQVPT